MKKSMIFTIIIAVIILIALVVWMSVAQAPEQESPASNTTNTEINTATPSTETNTTEQSTNFNNQANENMQAIMITNKGSITLELFNNDAPKTVENFVKLAQNGFYNGTRFHRVIKDFMIQGGDPLSKDMYQKPLWGTGGPGYAFADEINSHKIVRGALAMANAGPNTNGSQFFIVTTTAAPWLDGKHTVFGKVISNMETVDLIENTPTGNQDQPIVDVIVQSISIK